ncbi:hypothetical protein LOTGIDRAFT_160599 [Lottia gigantea]|uniref:Peptidase M12B domain-containing protein n=1 Tax=Lottia gigantea TaxID=225164 RepID=V4AL34_LOTGI|nr:hypothetical protein LOTGIDRAFT_160599 [Lottia gigantea]ESO95450.1 hypothetical protein LOTGIDRAFT_160599 [Lottia gigantea]
MADGVPWFAGNMWSNQGSQWNGGANMWVPPGNGMFGKEELGVELLVFLDDSIYHGMKDEMLAMGQPVPDSVIFNLLKQRYAIIVQGMDLRYGDIAATDYSIKVRLKGVMICTKPQASFWTSARASKQLGKERGVVDVDDALDDFRDYLKQFGHAFPEYDHAMTFTGFDIASEGKTSTIGVAFFEGICSDLSVSIIEDHGNTVTTIETATHELGHSLGSEHDGTGNLCQSDLQYIMAYYVGTRSEQIETNPWKFSDCSITYFRLFKETLKRKNRNCLFDPATTGNLFEWTVFTRQQALQKYTPDIQCKIFQGGMSYHCKGMVPDDKICNKLYCYIVKTGQCKPIQAMEGTPCGFKQWCLRGECKMDTSAPPYM